MDAFCFWGNSVSLCYDDAISNIVFCDAWSDEHRGSGL